MQLRDNGLRFSPITIVLHWIVAILLFSIIGLASVIACTVNDAQRMRLEAWQNLLGVALFLLSVYRLWARLSSFHPLPLGTPNPVEVIVSRSIAVALALAMVLLPVAAWLSRSAGGEIVVLPGGYAVPALIEPGARMRHVIDVLFRIGAIAFLAGLALHLFGALKNHFVLKNDVLKRMLGKQVEL
ncbi:cytochrome B561 [Burkholderia lata]|uniref:cytochrome b n=1 Tax=Burkholderia lata (strain ATCC 17760 / DSM 23089 / LMG 22485 / NCIMB 9086 / R18194 / 383) TaxID=482957 RepID=UPI0014532638|nr:cytochrome b/b6 domain-containing protein [Burkholderia lata]VWB37556.1 cytochrome B561 [Burkholderia lata]